MEDLCVRPGQPATFSVVITGQPIPEIRWFKVWSNHNNLTHKADTGPRLFIHYVLHNIGIMVHYVGCCGFQLAEIKFILI